MQVMQLKKMLSMRKGGEIPQVCLPPDLVVRASGCDDDMETFSTTRAGIRPTGWDAEIGPDIP